MFAGRHIYKRKLAILTSDSLVLANPGPTPVITDVIPLHEIKSCELVDTINELEDDSEEGQGSHLKGKLFTSNISHLSAPASITKLHVLTMLGGVNAGNHFVLRFDPSPDSRPQEWLRQLAALRTRRLKDKLEEQACEGEPVRSLALLRHRLRVFYESFAVQWTVCMVVVVGFVVDMMEAQVTPSYGTDLYSYFAMCDIVFTSLFTLEVLINMVSCSTSRCPFVGPFFRKWLNIFDLTHACASIASIFLMLFTDYAQGEGSFVESFPALKMLRIARLMRIFKVFQ